MTSRTIKGRVAVAGIGESVYYKRGQSPDPEPVLAFRAILAACADAGIDPRDIDGFVSFSNDRNDASRVAAALGTKELRWSTMQWGGGGGGGSGAVAQAAAAIAGGFADTVVVFRALAQGQFGRFGQGGERPTVSGEYALSTPYGMLSPAQMYAMKVQRFFHETGVGPSTQRAVALASYHHAEANPRAVMHGRPLTADDYDDSRWIVEPFRLFDCCLENDGAAALVFTTVERARDLDTTPVCVLAAAMGSEHRAGAPAHNAPLYGSSTFTAVAPRLYAMAGLGPSDVDVVQSYENFTGGVVMSLIEHGFCTAEEANDVLTFENLVAPTGKLPVNTSGGNLAECYVHGLELQVEAVRQIRGQSSNQVPGARVALVSSGPMVTPASNVLFGSEEARGMTMTGATASVGGTPSYLPAGLPVPRPMADGLDGPYWEAASHGQLVVQRCADCRAWQWGPEWICHACHSFDLGFEPVEPVGVIYSWERIWHPVHRALAGACPYVVVLVALPQAGDIRMIGNLLGDPEREIVIGSPVAAEFEIHDTHTLVHWKVVTP